MDEEIEPSTSSYQAGEGASADESTPLLKNLSFTKLKGWEDHSQVGICSNNDDSGMLQPLAIFGRDAGDNIYSWEGSYASGHDSSIQDSGSIHIQVGTPNLVSQKYESLDYDICENVVFLEEHRKKQSRPSSIRKRLTSVKQIADSVAYIDVKRWVAIWLIGFLTAATACIITIAIDKLTQLKFSTLKHFIDKCFTYECLVAPLGFWLLFCSIFVAIGSVLVTFIAPVAAGSGIPVIKCYLNGVKVPDVVRFKTLVVKALGIVTSMVGGLAVGKEGPMIHCGAVIAAGVSQGKSTAFRKDFKVFENFREDHEKRDFVSAGAAAGVAAAFGAPVGGVLFSLEEGASFWNQALTLRIFFCSMVSFFTLNLIMSAYVSHPWELNYPGLLNFGQFDDLDYVVWELLIYAIMGVIGGVLGALYNHLNFILTVFRLRYVKHPLAKVLEVVLVCCVGIIIAFLTTVLSSDCQMPRPSDIKYPIQLKCPDGEFSAFGAIWFQTPEESVQSLFHDPEASWSHITLAIFFCCYFFLGCWTYGLSISSGLFIPTLLIGAAWGRLFGIGVTKLLFAINPLYSKSLCPSKFAIVGAASMLGGVVRMTISLTVILMEAIGNITFGLPIMISVMIAKWVGDYFNEGLYDIHIQLASVPLLPWEPPTNSYHIYASKVMSSPVVCLKTIENVGKIINILKTETHNGFPVVETTDDSCDGVDTFGVFRGLILRWQLIVLLQHKMFNEIAEKSWKSQKLTLKDFRDAYPRHPSIQQIHISSKEESYSMDLRPYMNRSAYTISVTASLPRIFRLFRGLGLRHLPVVDERNNVVGMVTRKDIARFRAKKYGDLEELIISVS